MQANMMIIKRTINVMSGTIILKGGCGDGGTGEKLGMIRTRASEACRGAIIKRKSYFSSRHGDSTVIVRTCNFEVALIYMLFPRRGTPWHCYQTVDPSPKTT